MSTYLNVPNMLLKTAQRRILNRILYTLPVSEYASAYVPGKSLRDNAIPHTGKEVVVKLDVSQFYDHIDDDMVFMIFRQLDISDTATSLLTNLCVCQGRLPQGAPTSPYLANLVMKHFDERVGKHCKEYGIAYTRYCDDMTFSGTNESMQQAQIIPYIRKMLYRMGFSLNETKTKFVNSAQQQRVTGIVVNEKSQVPRALRRKIRQVVYYCKKFSVQEYLHYHNDDRTPDTFLKQLLGTISYAKQIAQNDAELLFTVTDPPSCFIARRGILYKMMKLT